MPTLLQARRKKHFPGGASRKHFAPFGFNRMIPSVPDNEGNQKLNGLVDHEQN